MARPNYHYQSIPKDFISKNLNEDRIRCEDNFVAIADGAGGTGIYCGEWADFLLQNLPKKPIKKYADFYKWYLELQEPFLEVFDPKAAIDGHIKRRFSEEGSSSTLAVVWKLKDKYYWLCYGDSSLFFIKGDTYKSFPFQDSTAFENSTHLLNLLQVPIEAHLKIGTIDAKDRTVILATDALSKYIFKELETNKAINEIANTFYNILDTEHKFIDHLKQQNNLDEDDYSIICWQPNPFL
jgi:serine/threonine protein phosphatase PrpC